MTAALGRLATQRPTLRQRVLRLMPWHRRLALLACVGVFCWAATGMLHPLMSALQPRPAQMMPPQAPLLLDGLKAPGPLLAVAGIAEVEGLRLLVLDGQPYYQARLPGAAEPRYWDARSGVPVDLVARHATRLAAHYLGSAEGLAYGGSLSSFNGEYAFINRLLPAARVDTSRDDGLRVYLDLQQDRLGTLVDERKAWFSVLFQQLHTFAWLKSAGWLRPLVMLLILASVVATVVLGVGLFFARPRARTRLRRVHGWVGLGIALASLSFASSGAWHLLHKVGAEPWPQAYSPRIPVGILDAAPAANWLQPGEVAVRLGLVSLDGHAAWRLQSLFEVRYLALDGQPLGDDAARRYANQRLAHHAGQLGLGEPLGVELQTRFDHEYGFVFKRLPVLKATYADAHHTSLYVDPLDGALASRVRDADRAEGWAFAYLHKWDYLGALGKPVKDATLTALAAIHVLLALMGLWLFARGRRA
ncbi:PepSY domain-containing protein [Metapseudomonas resinovorans]|uniref:PepSY domain-containing protein n=1 Tax=Metapseudomonas resinovorans NBRC 106553 TaxID=1245471 RepID=S6BIW2_METRE|nr:PepSY domain-containing protein [Pseudomonas resinovorans]BAN49139.1 hypothetical protein PCA10_34070 [Pseudomonas resinovorans NBRC 106553]